MLNNNFNFFIPLELAKSQNKESGKEDKMLKGIASTPDKDSDEEFLDPLGFDLSYFNKYGLVNWHHRTKESPDAIIGEPTKSEITKKGLYIEAKLYDTPLANQVYQIAETLQKNSKTRRLGFSIEGTTLERDTVNPKIIKRARITGVAVTHMPKNPKTFAEILKGEIDESSYIPEYDVVYEKTEGGGQTIKFIANINSPDGDNIKIDTNHNLYINDFLFKSNHDCGKSNKKTKKSEDEELKSEESDEELKSEESDEESNSGETVKKDLSAGHVTGTETTNKTNVSGAPLKKESLKKKPVNLLSKSEVLSIFNKKILGATPEMEKKLLTLVAKIQSKMENTQDLNKPQEIVESEPKEISVDSVQKAIELLGVDASDLKTSDDILKSSNKMKEEDDEDMEKAVAQKQAELDDMKKKLEEKRKNKNTVEKAVVTEELLSPLLDELKKIYTKQEELFKASASVEKAIFQEIQNLKVQVDELYSQPTSRKSKINSKPVDKNFNKAVDEVNQIYSPNGIDINDRNAVLDVLEKAAFNETTQKVDEFYVNAVTAYESSGELPLEVLRNLAINKGVKFYNSGI